MRDELTEGRNILEHWPETMPIFNVSPRGRPTVLTQSSKTFAARNPHRRPDWGFTNKAGALLLPNVSAAALHELLDAVEAEALAYDEMLARFIPQREPSPWLHQHGEWWPNARGGV